MDRRQFLAAAGMTCASFAFGTPAIADPTSDALGKVDIYSRHLQWLRSPDEVAKATLEMGFNGVDVTVRPYPGHVDPARVKTDLPPFVKTLREHGLLVRTITAPITDADSPYAEDILRAASELDIRRYWWGIFHYQDGKPIMEQLDALKPRVAKLAALNERYGVAAMYHLYAGSHEVGGPVWDMLYLLRDFDPKHVGLHYDTAHMMSAGDLGTWRTNLRVAGPYVLGVSLKDSVITKLQDGRWSPTYVPLGEGEIELPDLIEILREIHFDGPVEIQAEYQLGGAQDAAPTLTWPRKRVLNAMARDLQVYRKALAGPPPSHDVYLPDGLPFINKPFAQAGGTPVDPTKVK
jgi:sugar phosphate isomerase/epimerase